MVIIMEKLKDSLSKKAAAYFKSGYNCAESVLMTMQEAWEMDQKTPNIATAFGGGIGRCGSVCGSVTGGILAINVKYGRSKPEENKEKAYTLAQKFYKEFENKFGSAICYELIECDLTSPEGHNKYKELNIAEKKCVEFVKGAVKILMELSEEL